jgi:hypothetical protein
MHPDCALNPSTTRRLTVNFAKFSAFAFGPLPENLRFHRLHRFYLPASKFSIPRPIVGIDGSRFVLCYSSPNRDGGRGCGSVVWVHEGEHFEGADLYFVSAISLSSFLRSSRRAFFISGEARPLST